MPARPPESPIDVSSNSPTPTRPPISLPRRSSSRLREMPDAAQSSPPRAQTEDQNPIPVPVPRRRGPFVLVPAQTSRGPPRPIPRHGLALPTGPSNAGPSRTLAPVIDLTSDDDDIEFTGGTAPAPIRRPIRGSSGGAEARGHGPGRPAGVGARSIPAAYDVNAWRDRNRLDQIGQDAERATRELIEARENDHARQTALANMRERAAAVRRQQIERYNLAPPPDAPPLPAHRARIGLGGAVLRRGNQQINYQAPPPRRHRIPPPDEYLPPDEHVNHERDQRFYQERLDRVRRARDAQLQGHPEMIEQILNNLMRDGDRDQPFDELFNRLRPAGGYLAHQHHPAARLEEASVITARQPIPVPVVLPEGFTSDFDLNDTIEIDQPRHAKRYMACTRCGDPLYLNDGQKTQADRVWGLRCGHLLDQKCLFEISGPQEEKDRLNILRPPPAGLDILGDESAKGAVKKRGGKRKSGRKTANEPVEYEWKCPVKGCGWRHVSVLKEMEWKQDEEEGAVQLYV